MSKSNKLVIPEYIQNNIFDQIEKDIILKTENVHKELEQTEDGGIETEILIKKESVELAEINAEDWRIKEAERISNKKGQKIIIITLQKINSSSTSLSFKEYLKEKNRNIILLRIEDIVKNKIEIDDNDWVIVTGHCDGKDSLYTKYDKSGNYMGFLKEKKFTPDNMKEKFDLFFNNYPKNILFYNCHNYKTFCSNYIGYNNTNIYCLDAIAKRKQPRYLNTNYNLYQLKFGIKDSIHFKKQIYLKDILNKILDNTLDEYMSSGEKVYDSKENK